MGDPSQHDAFHATFLPESIRLAGMYHTGDIHFTISHLAGYWHTKRPAKDAADVLPVKLPPTELCCQHGRWVSRLRWHVDLVHNLYSMHGLRTIAMLACWLLPILHGVRHNCSITV